MTWHEWTQRVVWISFGVFVAAFLLLGIWDLVLIAKGRLTGKSASGVVLELARTQPILLFAVAFMLGILAGHFLWPQVVRLVTRGGP